MKTRNWSFLAIIFIVLGIAGMFYQGFKFNEELPSYQHKWDFKEDELKSLLIDSSYDIDMTFVDSPDNNNYIEISGAMEQANIDKLETTTIANGSLQLPLKEENRISFLSFNFQTHRQQITVALANRQMLDNIKVDIGFSSGTYQQLRAKNIELASSSGNIKVNTITAEKLKLSTFSGNITSNVVHANTEVKITSGNIKITELEGSLKAETTSGNITAENVQGTVNASGTSGNIKFDNFKGNGVFKLTSGNIRLTGQRSDSLDISVSSGNVNLSEDSEFKGIYDLQTSSGSIKSPDSPRVTSDLIKIRAFSGNITIKN